MAEARGRAQAATLRATQKETPAHRLRGSIEETVNSSQLRRDDIVVVREGDLIPGDGEVVDGIAYVNEAAITGESAPVLKEPGTDIHSSVTGGTQVVSDSLRIRITADPGSTFLDRMIALVEGAVRQRTPNEIALAILLAALTIVFLLAVATLQPFAIYAGAPVATVILVALLVCLIPTTIGGLLSAIGIAGMDRVTRFNVLAMSGRAVEAAGDVDTLLLDKTGTITYGNRLAAELIPVGDSSLPSSRRRRPWPASATRRPKGGASSPCRCELGAPAQDGPAADAEIVPFSAETRMSGTRVGWPQLSKGGRGRDRGQPPVSRPTGRTGGRRRAHLAPGRHAAGARG